MHVVVTGKQLNVSTPLRGRPNAYLADAITTYFGRAIRAQHPARAGGNDHNDQQINISEDGQPVVIAEMTSSIEILTVGDADIRTELANREAFIFQNCARSGINIIFRQHGVNLGWFDPNGNSSTMHQ